MMNYRMFKVLVFPCLMAMGHPAAAQSTGQSVSGVVFEDVNRNGSIDPGEKGIAKVIVSDQVSVTETDQNGHYTLPKSTLSVIVFVSLPNDFGAVGPFWKANKPGTDATIDFALARQPVPKSFQFIQASDTHISESSRSRMDKFRVIVDSVNPALVLVTGDLVKDALRVPEEEATRYYELFRSEIGKVRNMTRLVPGNHELFGIERHLSLVSPKNPLYGRTMYHRYFGPDYYSFNYGGIHFIGLNSLEYEDLWYYGRIDDVQKEWLKKDLATVPASMPIVTFQHVPFFSGGLSMQAFEEDGPGRSLEKEHGKTQFRHVVSNAMEILDLFKGHNFPLALAGHYHFQQKLSMAGVQTRFEQTGAVIGGTPSGPYRLPSGVTVYTVKDGKIDAGEFVTLDR